MPGSGAAAHRGRRPGTGCQAPASVFPAGDGLVPALACGRGAGWVKNTLAAGGCGLRARGRTVGVTAPRLYHDETRRGIRPAGRQALRAIRTADFPSLKTAPAAGRS